MTEPRQHDPEAGGTTHEHVHENCYCGGMGPIFSRFARAFGPPESANHHFRQARLEFLRGLRAVIDDRIETLSRRDRKGTRVPVD